ncbi:MAG: ATP-binding protein [Candidatus Woesearchaeota archaeon]
MILKETLRKVVKSQREELYKLELGIQREELKKIKLDLPFALVISGIRRCGKSTLLKQLTNKVKGFYYFNFEDPRAINFDLKDFEKLNEIFIEEFGDQDYYFFDEIQNVQKWELFIRAMLDKNKHFLITGSNASLLSKELGTRLTGRHLRQELFPFSFKEFLELTKKEQNKDSFKSYLSKGGFPEYLKFEKSEILHELLNDIIFRDIAIRYKIKNTKALKEIALYLITNIGKEFSYNHLKKIFNIGSINSIISFISYFEDAYLLFTVPRFNYSLKKQIISPKKIYSIDNGISNVNSASFSEDKGRMIENMVYLNLRRKYKNIFYFKEQKECDFIIKDGNKIKEALQVCYELNEENKDREIEGLTEALEEFKLKKGYILTFNQTDKIKIKDKVIIITPVWKWMLKKQI